METISKSARQELIVAVRKRYENASKCEKGLILAEFTAVTGFHRKHAIRILNQDSKEKLVEKGLSSSPGRRIYNEAVKSALIVLWEASDRICGKRLKAVIPTLLAALERHGHMRLETEVRKNLLAISAATIDRMMTPVRKCAGSRRRRHSSKKISKEIPVKTFSDWEDPSPGFLEIDFVVHGGGSMSGEYLHSFIVTDVCSGWIEAVPLLAREQKLVIEALKMIAEQLPVAIQGIDSDNDGAFINETLNTYCKEVGIKFTRSRPHHKNDQAWIEQKNGAVIRKMVGHERLSGIVAGQALAHLLQAVRLFVNYFQPSFKLRERVREGSKVKKSYFAPATPCDRLLAHQAVDSKTKDFLRKERERLDPLELLQRIRQGQSALAALIMGEPSHGPDRESLDKFLAALPELWRTGEVRPTHRKKPSSARHWRTRKDPFEHVWTDILLWLQKEPDLTAKTLLDRLIAKNPDRYDGKLLRTLQRRVGEWRRTMARELVFAGAMGSTEVRAISAAPPSVESALRLATLDSAPTPPKEI